MRLVAIAIWLAIFVLPPAAAEPPNLPIRFGSHATFHRIVFDWTALVEYRAEQNGRAATISFDRPARIDEASFRSGAAAMAASVAIEPSGERLIVRLTLPEGAQIRHFRTGTKIVVDVTRAPESKAEADQPSGPARRSEAPPTSSPPAAEKVTAPARKPISLRPKQDAVAAAAPDAAPPPAAAPTPTAAPAAAAHAAGAPGVLAVDLVRTPDGQGLRFAWAEPVGAAVFGRGQHLWIVFDRHARLDVSRLKKAEDVLGAVDVIDAGEGSQGAILRLAPAGGTGSAARREGDAWVVDIGRLARTPDVPIATTVRNASDPAAARLLIEVPGARSVLHIRDPDIGDELAVVPTTAAGSGVERERDFQQFRVLATAQGAAIQPRADSLSVRPVGSGVEIGHPKGLHVSDTREVRPREAARAPLLFDFATWRRGGPNRFNEDRQALHRAAAETPDEKRNARRLDLLRFLFAYGHAEDALGLARLIEQDDPDLVATAQLRAIRGVSALLIGDLAEAQRQLHHASLDGQPEAALWRGALAMAQGDARAARAQMGRSADLYKNYPPSFANRLNLWNAEARLYTGDHAGAEARLDAVTANKPIASDRAQAVYLRGRLLLAKGDREAALAAWAELDGASLTPGRTAASLDRIDILLEDAKITPAEAITSLERLRFSWRGDELEFRMLTRLGRLHIAAGDHRAGLAMLRNAITLYPSHREAKGIAADISEALAALFASEAADKLSPVSAIALFDEFRDWLPKDPRGEEIASRLADRLVAVDLLDRAGDLLEQLVKARPSGDARAQAGAKLAFVRLLDRKPEAALEALKSSESLDLGVELARERGRFEARALADLGRAADALQRLAGDDSGEADVLRADIHWRAQNWTGAAEALDRLVGTPASDATLADDAQRQALYLAVALALADDKEGLKRLDERVGAPMQRGAYKDLFRVVLSQPGEAAGDVREIAARVGAAAPFMSFLASYRQRLVAAEKTGS